MFTDVFDLGTMKLDDGELTVPPRYASLHRVLGRDVMKKLLEMKVFMVCIVIIFII